MPHRTTWTAVGVALLLSAGAAAAFAEEARKEATGPSFRPMELFACKFKEGKGMADLQQANARYGAWLDATDQHGYWAFLLLPYYVSSDQDFDFLWAGGWRTGADMARAIQRYVGEAAEVMAEYGKVMTCAEATNFAILDLSRAPSPPDSGPVTFSNCTIQEGRKLPDALAAIDAWIAYGKEHGIASDNFLLFPTFGETHDAKYSFKWVTTASWDNWGKAYDQHGTGGGWLKAMDLFGGLLDCDSGRIYVSQRVRQMAPAKQEIR